MTRHRHVWLPVQHRAYCTHVRCKGNANVAAYQCDYMGLVAGDCPDYRCRKHAPRPTPGPHKPRKAPR